MIALRQVFSSIFRLGVLALILGALLLIISLISGRGASSDALLFLFAGFACSGVAWPVSYLLHRAQKGTSKQENTVSAQGVTAKQAASAAVPPGGLLAEQMHDSNDNSAVTPQEATHATPNEDKIISAESQPGGLIDDQMYDSNDEPVAAPEEAMETMLDKDKIRLVDIGLIPLVSGEQLPLARELVKKFLDSDSDAEKLSMASTLLTRGGENLLSLLEPEWSPWAGDFGSKWTYYNNTGVRVFYRLREGAPLQQAVNQLLAYSRWVQVHFQEQAPQRSTTYTRGPHGHVHIRVLSDASTVGCDDAFWELCAAENIRIVAHCFIGGPFYNYVDDREYDVKTFYGYKSLDDFGDTMRTELVAGDHGRPEWLHANKERNP